MSAKPPYYPQETEYSCGVACLRMVLEHLGVTRTEEELRALTFCTFAGTDAFLLVDAARQLGFADSTKQNLNWNELLLLVHQELLPIVYLRMRLKPGGLIQTHSVIVVEINEHGVLTLDPAQGEVGGEVIHAVGDFAEMWESHRGLTILVRQSHQHEPFSAKLV